MLKEYKYVGPKDLLNSARSSHRKRIDQKNDVLSWVKLEKQKLENGIVTATFIVDRDQRLWIADRHSEHVICAEGESVLAAGEITFAIINNNATVIEITNQSTGYCPEPESWNAVAPVLDKIGLDHPMEYTTKFIFRRCDYCDMKNLVKDEIYECGVCNSPLNRDWNFN